MTAMTCQFSGLFSIGEDFDDEDLLETDWSSCPPSVPSDASPAVSSFALRSSSSAQREAEGLGESSPHGDTTPRLGAPATATGQPAAVALRQPSSSSSSSSSSSHPPVLNQSRAAMAPQQEVDDFDEWDVDLADLEECESRSGAPLPVAPPTVQTPPTLRPPSSSAMLRPSSLHGERTAPDRTPCGRHLPPRLFSAPQPPKPRPSPSPFPRTVKGAQEPQRPGPAPRPAGQTPSLFETFSPSPGPSPALAPHPLHAPVLTNRLVQLVSASSRFPRKRPRWDPVQPRTRRFPGPAGLLPDQPQDQNLDQIVVSAPQTPAHGVRARLPGQGPASQSDEEDFGGGPWAAMKAEMGLDERNPSCFLHSYSVVMVLRKAALKQLARNKVPNMAVLLKSIVHTQADARAVFKDPTGEIQGTVHRRLLEDRVEELKAGAVLLLKQVGVFSPSHRNHYLNVTPSNLLRVFGPGGAGGSASSRRPPLALEPASPWAARPPDGPRGPVSHMQLELEEEEDDGRRQAETLRGPGAAPSGGEPGGPEWGADDDLDALLGELPEESYSL